MSNIQTYFDSVASDYSAESAGGFWNLLRRGEVKAVQAALGPNPLGDILELGSGSGYYSSLLSAHPHKSLTCVDFSQPMLDHLSVKNVTKVLADIENYRSDRTYDLIFCAGALEFLSKPEKIFENAYSMLNPSGRLILLSARQSFFGQFYRRFHRSHGFQIRLFRRDDIVSWAGAQQLALTAWKVVPFFSFTAVLSRKSHV